MWFVTAERAAFHKAGVQVHVGQVGMVSSTSHNIAAVITLCLWALCKMVVKPYGAVASTSWRRIWRAV